MNATISALSSLARVRDPEARAQLALGVADICIAAPLSRRAEPLADEILLALARKAEQRVRMAMAARLADCAWAPHEVIRFLAFDAPAVAEPIIARSARLTEADLIHLADEGTRDHREMIARRPGIGMAVTSALARRAEAIVMRALAANPTASLSELAIETINICAREDEELAAIVAARTETSGLADETLTAELTERIGTSVIDAFGKGTGIESVPEEAVAATAVREDEDTLARKLVDKLVAAGTLNGSFALRALTQGNDALFDHAIASLCTISVTQWRKALAVGGVRAAALACRAARIDRSVFPTVLRGLQRSGRVHVQLAEDAMSGAAKVFTHYTAGSACDALRRLSDSV